MAPLVHNLHTRLEYLELIPRPLHPSSLSTVTVHGVPSSSTGKLSGSQMNIHMPALRVLKVPLDNVTFSAMAGWDLPALTNLCIVASDSGYVGEGFTRFFQTHGYKVTRLEFGHSSSLIEERYLTTPRHLAALQRQTQSISLSKWCPNLCELICSADTWRHCRSPDGIAPHILLPSHQSIELIGIRDIDSRLLEDSNTSSNEDMPYPSLLEQVSYLLREGSFPRLRFIRDLSARSHIMRTIQPRPHVLQFWAKVIARCAERAVWLEDYTGVNVTLRTLRRASPSDS